MQYTYTELITYLFLYGFIGWALEAAYVAVKERRFRNRGFFNLPICPEYGVMMDILIILLPTLETHYVLQFLACLTVVSVVEYLAGGLSKRIWRKKLWKYENRTLFSGEKKGLFVGLAKAGAVMAAVLLVHPVVFWLISMVPKPALQIACAVIAALLAADFYPFCMRSIKAGRMRSWKSRKAASEREAGRPEKAGGQDLSDHLEASGQGVS